MPSSFKIIIFTLILALMGMFFIPKLAVQLNPSHRVASIQVVYHWPNASSYALERQITSVLESGFSTIRGLENIESRSSKGNGFITLTFNKHTSLDVARFEVATIIRQLYPKLPQRTSYPQIRVNSPDSQEEQSSFLSYSVSAPLTPYEIQQAVKNFLEPALGSIQGIDKTQVYGANDLEWVINYPAIYLQSLQITKQDIIQALQDHFTRQSLGEVNFNNQHITLSIRSDLEEINWNIPIKKIDDRIVYLSDFASISQKEQEARHYYRINSDNAITLAMYAKKGANTIALVNEVESEINFLKKSLPSSISITKTFDNTLFLKTELAKIYQRAFYTVLILLLFVLIVSRSFRYLLITVLSIVATLCIAFLLYYLLKIEIQLYSLAGITISFGLIIDNTIVMIDHIKNQGNQKVFLPILASTLTTIGALSIIFFLDEPLKYNLIDFAYVIIINLAVSLFIALFFVPALLQKFILKKKTAKPFITALKQKFYHGYEQLIRFLVKQKKMALVFIILVFGIPFFMLPQQLDNNDTWFKKTYNTTLGNEWYRDNIRPYVDRYLGGTFRLFSYYVFENAYYGKKEETKLYIIGSMEKGATIHQMNDAFLQIENFLKPLPEIKQFTSNVYSGDYASIEITFKEAFSEGSFPYILKSRVTRKALDLGGMSWNIYGVGNAFSTGGGINQPINFRVLAKGYNYDEVNKWANTLKSMLVEHPRIQEVVVRENSFRPRRRSFEYVLDVEKNYLALKNIPMTSLYQDLASLSLSKFEDLNLNINGRYTPVRLESRESKNFDIWNLQHTVFDTPDYSYQLKQYSTIKQTPEDENIYKENQEYLRLVEFQYTGAARFGNEYLEEKLKELKLILPLGFSFEKKDAYFFFFDNKKSNYAVLLFLILSITFFIAAILFESLRQPFIILSMVPISFIGVFITFYWFDFNFDQGGIASFVLLSGLTVNASIFIVNGYNELKKKFPNEENVKLYLEAYRQKIVPILLTIISTVLGFIPFVIGGQNEVFWFALAVGTMGGLLFSVLAIIFYLPIFSISRSNIH
jgi:multidrug efflux pump subunit AcrB